MEKDQKMTDCIKETTLSQLCDQCPVEFKDFVEHCRNMGFEEEPDYNYLMNLLKKCKKAAINKETVLVNDSLEAST